MKLVQNKDTKSCQKATNNKDEKTYFSVTNLAVVVLFVCQTASICFFYNKFFTLEKSQQSIKLGIEEIFRKELKQSLYDHQLLLAKDLVSKPLESKSSTLKRTPAVQFKPPRHRRSAGGREERSVENELNVQLQGPPNGDEADDEWLQLTSYAQIPYNAIQEFCSRTKNSCPAGPKGNIGFTGENGYPGVKGDTGIRGLPGVQGPRGLTGPSGIIGRPGRNGQMGIKGGSGQNGVDGRDGLPGEPGLDGIPGRNGLDGTSGIDGTPGHGEKGASGQNGRHGFPGKKGHTGRKGEQGRTGLAGPRGRAGENGKSGKDGEPGKVVFLINATIMNELLVPQAIPGQNGVYSLLEKPDLDEIPDKNGLHGMSRIEDILEFGKKDSNGHNIRHGKNRLNNKDNLLREPGKDVHHDRNGFNRMSEIGITPVFGNKESMELNGRHSLAIQMNHQAENGKARMDHPDENGDTEEDEEPIRKMFKINEAIMNELLIPPTITGPRGNKTIIVRENDHLRLRCTSSGNPAPKVVWSREDDMAIPTGKWKDGTVVGDTLSITNITRDHIGIYRCDASNGIGIDNKTFEIKVYFSPFIRITQWQIYAENGNDKELECQVEAFPIAIQYWVDDRGRILEDSSRIKINRIPNERIPWKSKLTLQLKNITNENYGNYYCFAKNDLSLTRGQVTLYQRDPSKHTPDTGIVASRRFGKPRPDYTDYNDLCPPPVVCPTCPEQKMELGSSSLYCLQVLKFGKGKYSIPKRRSKDCILSAIGKAVFHRHVDSPFGAWLRDPLPDERNVDDYYWDTLPNNKNKLYEYNNKDSFKKRNYTHTYSLTTPFSGNSHVIYNGSFFYQENGKARIVRYDLSRGTFDFLNIPLLLYSGSNYLYSGSHDYIDFNTDENGLWAIYGTPNTNNYTIVAKIDPWDFKIEYSWNITISHHKFGEMFIVCGVLYGIDSSTEKNTRIRFAVDLYKKALLDIDLKFHNPFSKTTMLGYNHNRTEIYSWDNGNHLTYPIKATTN